MRRTSSQPATTAAVPGDAHGQRAAPIPPPLPVLLVLEPTMAGGPWSLATWRAASTLQLHELGPGASDPASASTIAWALEVQAVERIVVGGEGRGAPPAAFDERVQAVRRLVRALGTRSVPVDAVWVDAAAGRRVTVQPDGVHDALLDALLHPRTERLDA